MMLSAYFRPDLMFRIAESRHVLRHDPQCARYIHVDIGVTGDALGMTMMHLIGYKMVERVRSDGTTYQDRAPVGVVDFHLRVVPPKGSEIDLSKVRSFIQELRDYGVPIWRVTYDTYQSRGEIQTLRKLGFTADAVSVDRTDEAYVALKHAYAEGRIMTYRYATLERELRELERDIDKRKVDHPARSPETGGLGSKDVADSLAGSFYSAITDKRILLPNGSPVPRGPVTASIDRRVAVPGGTMLWGHLDKEATR
jgi:hypothetical protein